MGDVVDLDSKARNIRSRRGIYTGEIDFAEIKNGITLPENISVQIRFFYVPSKEGFSAYLSFLREGRCWETEASVNYNALGWDFFNDHGGNITFKLKAFRDLRSMHEFNFYTSLYPIYVPKLELLYGVKKSLLTTIFFPITAKRYKELHDFFDGPSTLANRFPNFSRAREDS